MCELCFQAQKNRQLIGLCDSQKCHMFVVVSSKNNGLLAVQKFGFRFRKQKFVECNMLHCTVLINSIECRMWWQRRPNSLSCTKEQASG